MTAEGDLELARGRLYELAVLLRQVPVDKTTRDLHLRALRLKKEVEQWSGSMPDVEQRRALFDELARVRMEAEVRSRPAAERRFDAGRPTPLPAALRHDDGTT